MNAIGSSTAFSTLAADAPAAAALAACYQHVRRTTMSLCAPLETEDYVVQSMPDASPAQVAPGAHDLVLRDVRPRARRRRPTRPFHPQYAYLFNSYYNALGERDRAARARAALAADRRRGLPLPRRTIDDAMRRAAATRADDACLQRLGAIDRARPAPRAAAPGADPHRPQARLRPQPAPAGLPRAASRPTRRGSAAPIGWRRLPGGLRDGSATTATASRSTTSRRGTRSSSRRSASPTGW